MKVFENTDDFPLCTIPMGKFPPNWRSPFRHLNSGFIDEKCSLFIRRKIPGEIPSLDDLHLIPGEGIIDLKDILVKLMAVGYERTLTLELTPTEIGECLERVQSWLQ